MAPPLTQSLAADAVASSASSFSPRATDVIIAVMGVTGAGKSTFISKCVTGPVRPVVGHDIEACTQNVGIFKCDYSPDIAIYLVDTPGFDDTTRSDKQVLQEIAFWLGKTYQQSVRLNGIIYFHRIIDPRMQGSARKNLFMFKKLCGEAALKNVILATTMWEMVDAADGERRESQLVSTPEFWGWMKEKGSQIRRHYNTKESALELLQIFVDARTRVALDIQCEIVDSHKTLDQTGAGQILDSAITVERENFRREIAELQAEWKEAMASRDSETADMIRQAQADMQKKIAELEQDRADLKLTLEAMEAQRGKVSHLEASIRDMEANFRQTIIIAEEKIKQLAVGKEQGTKAKQDTVLYSKPAERRSYQGSAPDIPSFHQEEYDAAVSSEGSQNSLPYDGEPISQNFPFRGEILANVSNSGLAFSPNGQRLTSVISCGRRSRRHTILLWEADKQGRFQQVQDFKRQEIDGENILALSPNGQWIASINGTWVNRTTVRLWKADPQGLFQVTQELECSWDGSVQSLCFSPDSQWLVLGKGDQTWFFRTSWNFRMFVWEADTGGRFRKRQTFEGDMRKWDFDIVFLTGSLWLFSAKSVLWKPDERGRFQRVQSLRGKKQSRMGPFLYIVSPDGQRVVFIGKYGGGIEIWRADEEGKFTNVQNVLTFEMLGRVTSVTFSPDCQWLALNWVHCWRRSKKGGVHLWQVDQHDRFELKQKIEVPSQGEVQALTFSPDSQCIALATHDQDLEGASSENSSLKQASTEQLVREDGIGSGKLDQWLEGGVSISVFRLLR